MFNSDHRLSKRPQRGPVVDLVESIFDGCRSNDKEFAIVRVENLAEGFL